MTNEEKQALIEYCEEVQGNNPESSDAYKVISIALATLTEQPDDWQQRAEAAEAKLAELEKQASEQKPFMYGIMTANGDAHFEDFCVSSDPGLLEDVIWEWNNTLADNEPKNRVVGLFTRPAPAINLAELVLDENDNPQGFTDWYEHHFATQPYKGASHVTDCENAWRAAILRKIEEAK